MSDPRLPSGPLEKPPPQPARNGLSQRLLWLTGLFVLFLSAVIYVPSMATFRDNWLGERLSQARAAALILEKAPPDSLPKPLVDELLSGMETTMIAIRIDNMRRLLAVSDMPPMVDFEIDLRQRDAIPQLMSAFDTLFFGGKRTMRVVGPPPRGGDFVEIVIPEGPLREAMLRFSWTMLAIALTLSTLTALAVFVTLIFGIRARFLPPQPVPVKVSLLRNGQIQGRFALLIVTTLHKLLLGSGATPELAAGRGLKLMVVDQSPIALFRAIVAGISGKLGDRVRGIHLALGEEIRIESEQSSVILDGELFEARRGHPIVLTPTAPVPFLRLAA